MKTVAAGLQGATPQLGIQPVDPALPLCGAAIGETGICSRKRGHYGACGMARQEDETPTPCNS